MSEDHEKSTFEMKKLRNPAQGTGWGHCSGGNRRQARGPLSRAYPLRPHHEGLVFIPRLQRDISELHSGCGCGEAEEKAAVFRQENLSEPP